MTIKTPMIPFVSDESKINKDMRTPAPPMIILVIISRPFAFSNSAATRFNSDRFCGSFSCISAVRPAIRIRDASQMSVTHFLQCFRQTLFSCKHRGFGHSTRSTVPHWPQCFSFSLFVALHFGHERATTCIFSNVFCNTLKHFLAFCATLFHKSIKCLFLRLIKRKKVNDLKYKPRSTGQNSYGFSPRWKGLWQS